MFVRNHMRRGPICMDPAAPLRDVIRVMALHKIHHVPVTDCRRHAIGLISDREIRAAAAVPDAHFGERRADEVMSRALHTIESHAGLACALDRLCQPGVDALFVQERGMLVGILTRADLLRALRRALAFDREGSSVEVSLEDPGDLANAFAVLREQKAEIRSAVVGTVRDDDGAPVLGLRLAARDPRPIERALVQAALTVLVPEEELAGGSVLGPARDAGAACGPALKPGPSACSNEMVA